jgi:conflict system STAND superfamily ATPase
MPRAGSFRIQDLSASLRDAHTPVGGPGDEVLVKLKEHSSVTLADARAALGNGITLPRTEHVTELVSLLNTHRVVMIIGPAGAGKSGLGKKVIEPIESSRTVIAFRAEEFAVPHLDQALQLAQIPANAAGIAAILAGQERKLLFIESVERLLETTDRHAFLDLLRFVAQDPSWQVLLTCRDYSADTVRSAFLEQIGIRAVLFSAPPLADTEIDEVVAQVPRLARPALLPFLRQLFRNPYILDMAARLSWPDGESLPVDERAFRDKLWRELVRHDDRAQNALPQRRSNTFVNLCLRRGKALQPYARCDDLDAEALQLLSQDGLVRFDPRTPSLGAPVHDVLEDWANITWINERHAINQGDRKSFVSDLGPFPAIRRGYRTWLGEYLQFEPGAADTFVLEVIADDTLPSYFKDDTCQCGTRTEEPSWMNFLPRCAHSVDRTNSRTISPFSKLASDRNEEPFL